MRDLALESQIDRWGTAQNGPDTDLDCAATVPHPHLGGDEFPPPVSFY